MQEEAVEVGARRTSYRWVVIGAALFLWLVLNLDRGSVPALLPYIRAEFGIDHDAAGRLIALFTLTYMLAQFSAGILCDRIGTKNTIRIAGITVVGTVFSGLAGTYQLLLGVRTALGAGEAHIWPALVRAIGQWTGPRERGRGITIALYAGSGGTALAPPLAALTIALTGNWQVVFWWLAVAGLVALLVFERFFLDSPSQAVDRERMDLAELKHVGASIITGSADGRLSLAELLRDPMLWVFSAVAFFHYCVYSGVTVWVVSFLYEQQGLDVVGSGLIGAVPLGVGLLGATLGGWLVDKYNLLRSAIVLSFGGLAPAIYLVAVAPRSLPVIALLLAIIGTLLSLVGPPIYTYQMRRYSPTVLGRAAGISGGIGSTGSFIIPLVTGYLITGQAGSYSYQNVFFLLMACAACGAIAALFLSEKPFARQVG